MSWTLTRRDLLKAGFTTAAVGATGVPRSALGAEEPKDWRWDRGVCRFCGVGCGIQVATARGGVVAVKGDPASPVNRGLLCMKGYALPEIQYGADRLTRPLLRMRNGRFDKKGDFVAVTWTEAFGVMEREWKRVHRELGPTGVAIMGSGQYTIPEGYAAVKLAKVGWRSNNLDPNARHCMASAVAGFMQTFGIDEPSGCYDDIELTDTVVLWGANMAEMHPMLWARIIDRRLRSPEYRVFNLTVLANRSSEGRTSRSSSSPTPTSPSGTTSRERWWPAAPWTRPSSNATASLPPGPWTSASACATRATSPTRPRRTPRSASAWWC